ncbi:flagellin [Marivita sp. GX14005]|uniref:flagellin n=1 Tax=Marivita sp. GX14005 TaxID=2942276 RepID=UPI002019BAC3|nr:flagellin [Marivita sp. GX14005]MCL3881759.1 hypothetical protein [Marivita sp. GX14005]
MRAIGDLASFIIKSRFQTNLQNAAETSAKTATTGIVEDKAKHLGGATLSLSLLERKSTLLQQHKRGIDEANVIASATQLVMGKIQDRTENLVNSLSLESQLQTDNGVKALSRDAKSVFLDTVANLNTEIGGRYLFAGTATNRPPLIDGAALLSNVQSSLGGVATANNVSLAVDNWFDSVGGGFEVSAYTGSTIGYLTIPLGDDGKATFGFRADDRTIRDNLKALAKASLASDPALGLNIEDQKALLGQARAELIVAKDNLVAERGTLGLTESRIAEASSTVDEELARLEIDRLTLVGVDQFEEVSKFEAAQSQLDIFYRVAARQGRASLAEYLR